MLKKTIEEIRDPRQSWKVKYNLHEIIIMTICAVVSGCEHWEDITDWCKVKLEWLRGHLGLKLENGIASHDTFQRVFSLLSPEELEHSFEAWTKSVQVKTSGEVVSIDGKTLRGSRDKEQPIVHMVSAWANENQLVLGQVRTEAKSNEITAIPKLLDMLDVQGCIVTIDALGCQKEITKKIIANGADYLLSLKENQPSLLEDVRLYFQDELSGQDKPVGHMTLEKGHGRIEKRAYYLETDIDWLTQKVEWPGLSAIGMVHTMVERDGILHEEDRYFITTVSVIELFAHAARSHWGIENSLHWCLDVIFHEDANRTRADYSGQNFSVIRRIALNLLKAHPSKMSLRRKRFKCEYDPHFLAQVLFPLL